MTWQEVLGVPRHKSEYRICVMFSNGSVVYMPAHRYHEFVRCMNDGDMASHEAYYVDGHNNIVTNSVVDGR